MGRIAARPLPPPRRRKKRQLRPERRTTKPRRAVTVATCSDCGCLWTRRTCPSRPRPRSSLSQGSYGLPNRQGESQGLCPKKGGGISVRSKIQTRKHNKGSDPNRGNEHLLDPNRVKK